MSLKHCILGLLSLGPKTGYDVKTTFDRSVRFIWNASTSQVYLALKNLEREGLITSEIVVQSVRPNKKVYTITETGLAELRRWLAEPLPDTFTKDEAHVRVFFSNLVDRKVAVGQLESYARHLREQIEFLESVEDRVNRRPSRRPEARRFQMISLRLKLAGARAVLAELESVLAEEQRALDVGDTSPEAAIPQGRGMAEQQLVTTEVEA